MVEVNECDYIEQVNATKYLQIDRLFLLRDYHPDFEQAEISFYITVRGHLDYNYCGAVGNILFASNVETGLPTSQTCHQHELSPISVTNNDVADSIFELEKYSINDPLKR